jgi:hypothetical protein
VPIVLQENGPYVPGPTEEQTRSPWGGHARMGVREHAYPDPFNFSTIVIAGYFNNPDPFISALFPMVPTDQERIRVQEYVSFVSTDGPVAPQAPLQEHHLSRRCLEGGLTQFGT